MPDLPTGTVTLLFTDIEGSTRLLQELGESYADVLAEHRRLLREAFAAHGGVEVDTQGDAFFYAFTEATAAVAAGKEAQQKLSGGPIAVRMGLHTGEPIVTEEGYVGIDVHRAARIMSAGHGGQVLVSETTCRFVDGDASLTDLGLHRLKDLGEPEKLYQLGGGDFPPLRTLDATNLPVAASPLLGRERELEELLALLADDRRLITVTGPGGTGKTRLALQVAAELVGTFKDGVFWVPLAGLRDPALVLPTVAQTLGARGELSEHLDGKELLLLLDNAEHLLAAAPALGELLAGAKGLRLLVTSRAPLHLSGEREYPLEPLHASDAVTLFCERARAAGRELVPDQTVAAICRRLDGLPLAIELAAARTKLLAPETLLQRLERALPLLTGGARDAPERQQTLRATIGWSYDLLDDRAKQLFGRLSVFAGSFSLEAAEEVCEADLDTLTALVDSSLLKSVGDDRFLMLETIREYAADRLEECSDSSEPRRRHAEWFTQLVDGAEPELEGPGQDAWLDRLEGEHDNIRTALRWALEREHANLALRLAGASATFWWVRGHWTEGRRWLEEALSQLGPQDRALRAKSLEGAAHLAYRQSDYVRAKDLAREGLKIARDLKDASRSARTLRVLGLVASGKGDSEGFRVFAEQSAESARESGDLWALLMALNNLGYLALEGGDVRRAALMFEEALQLARERGDHRSESFVLENLALVKLEQGMVGEACDDLAASLRLAHRLHFTEVTATDLLGIAAIAACRGDFEGAAHLLGGAQRLNQEIGSGLDPVEARVEARVLDAIERSLEPERYAEALLSGANRSPGELVEFALGVVD